MNVSPDGQDGHMEVETERFSEDVVDIVSLDYPEAWNDREILNAVRLADLELFRQQDDDVKNLSTWVDRYS